jgi:ubiquinone/menaquinone biosynthesis C-methylase UbiE
MLLGKVTRHSPATRDDMVAAQYAEPDQAVGYAEGYQGLGPNARYFRSRMHLVSEALAACSGGNLLDIGCGPGMMVRELLDTRPGDFQITALDRSPAMVAACAANAKGAHVQGIVGRAEALPLSDASFDVVLAMGVLEYAAVTAALSEIARVTRRGGLVIATMLNPSSPYRRAEWHVYWPLLRMLGALEAAAGIPPDRRHGAAAAGIRAYRAGRLQAMMTSVGLHPVDLAYYDVTALLPGIDRFVTRWRRPWPQRIERTVSRGWRRWRGTAYLIAARRAG